jgi:hypothetical protein
MLIAPIGYLKELLHLNGDKASDDKIPDKEVILELSQKRSEQMQAQQQQMRQEIMAQVQGAVKKAGEDGYEAGIAEATQTGEQ